MVGINRRIWTSLCSYFEFVLVLVWVRCHFIRLLIIPSNLLRLHSPINPFTLYLEIFACNFAEVYSKSSLRVINVGHHELIETLSISVNCKSWHLGRTIFLWPISSALKVTVGNYELPFQPNWKGKLGNLFVALFSLSFTFSLYIRPNDRTLARGVTALLFQWVSLCVGFG